MKVEHGGPGMPMLWRRHVPFAPEDGTGGAAGMAAAAEKKTPTPGENQAAAKPEEKKDAPAPAAASAKTEAAPPAKTEEKKDPAPSPAAAASPDERTKRIDELERIAKERLDAIDARLSKTVERSRLSMLRKLGADPDRVSDEDLLVLAPKVDPDEPAGFEALKKFRDSRKGLFRSAEVGPQERLVDLTKAAREDKNIPPHLREVKARMLNKLYGGGDS